MLTDNNLLYSFILFRNAQRQRFLCFCTCRQMDLYIRFWEYSCGIGYYLDWSIIIVRSNFKRNQQKNMKDLARFFKEYVPRYGYKYLCTEDDDYKYYHTLG